jgi:biotin transporter BioY
MFQDRIFEPKYFIGWIPSSLVLSVIIAQGNRNTSFVYILSMTVGMLLWGLIALGIINLIASFKKPKVTPVQWEIVWWLYPPIALISVFWGLIRAVGRF